MADDATIPVTAVPSLRAQLLTAAEAHVPEASEDGVTVAVSATGSRGLDVSGLVQIKDVTGRVVYRREVTGERSVTGAVTWRF